MNEAMDQDNQQRRLWRQYLAQAQPQSADLSALDPNVLAAYLDGTAKPDQIEQIESRLAWDPALLEELIELRELGNLEPAVFSPSLLTRAKDLMTAEPTRKTHPQPSETILYVWRRRFQWAAAAAAVLLACLGGYSVGRVTVSGQRQAETLVAANASLQMEELISDPALGIVLPVTSNNGR